MKERPLPMSAPLVIKTQEDVKKETRRCWGLEPLNYAPDHWEFKGFGPADRLGRLVASFQDFTGKYHLDLPCPYGAPRDVLWVRENWGRFEPVGPGFSPKYFYEAGMTREQRAQLKLRPSIHMPREACRLFLKLEAVRVERLHEITETSAKLEGARSGRILPYKTDDWQLEIGNGTYRQGFEFIWYDINGKKSWDHNPWV